MDSLNALVIDDDPEFCESMAKLVEHEGFAVRQAASLAQSRELLASSATDVVLIDLGLPDGDGLELDPRRGGRPGHRVRRGHRPRQRRHRGGGAAQGALDYLTKPIDRAPAEDDPRARAPRTPRCSREVAELRDELRELGRFGPLVGRSKAMQEVYDLISRVAPTEATVLVTGESGTGKELVAQTIHELSARRDGAVRRGQLRRDPAEPDRERAVRPREGQLHRRRAAPQRPTSSRPAAARCSSTRSPRCRSSCR